MSAPLLDVRGLRVTFATEAGPLRAVDDVSFELRAGELLALVGESGAGKSAVAATLLGLTRAPNARISGSAVLAGGPDLVRADDELLRRVRGERIAIVLQEPGRALNPVQRVGEQIVEQIRAHRDVSRAQARERAAELLGLVGIAGARERLRAYPHELSGGMRQRALLAMALSCDPEVLIADEPTTALDVTIQAQILALLSELRARTAAAVLLITHDLGVVAGVADSVAVMYGGRIVEQGPAEAIFDDPQHPYTWGLLNAIPRLDRPPPRRLPAIPGAPPSLVAPPAGCHFRPRCAHAHGACEAVPPLRARAGAAHLDRCVLAPERKRALRPTAGAPAPPAGAGPP